MTETKKIKKTEKGTRGENEIVLILGMVVTRVFEGRGMRVPDIKRSSRGCDIDGLIDYAFEVKRDETVRIKGDCLAWAQVESFAKKKAGRIPILFYRANNKKWRVKLETVLAPPGAVVPGPKPTIVDIDMDSFLAWFWADLDARIGRQLYAIKKRF